MRGLNLCLAASAVLIVLSGLLGCSSGHAIEVSAGGTNTCALLSTGAIKCWGLGEQGAIGDGKLYQEFDRVPVAQNVVGLPKAKTVSVGEGHVCAVTQLDEVWCWGSLPKSVNLEVFMGGVETRLVVKPEKRMAGSSHAVAGAGMTCAVFPDGKLGCWGFGANGRLGKIAKSFEADPVWVPSAVQPSVVALGGSHSCAIVHGGKVLCWGINSDGQLGVAPKPAPPEKVLHLGAPTGKKVGGIPEVSVDDDAADTIRALMESKIDNSFALGVVDAVDLDAGALHTCAVRANGDVLCWGNGDEGRLGLGDGGPRSTPTSVALPSKAIQVTAGGWHSCALLESGIVYCWGRGSACGNRKAARTRSQLTPVQVEELKDVRAIDAGLLHTCAVTNGGAVWCWGSGDQGQLGDGQNEYRQLPVRVTKL